MNNNKLKTAQIPHLSRWLAITTLVLVGGSFVQEVNSTELGLQNLSNQVRGTSIVIDGNREGWEFAVPYISDPSGDKAEIGQIDWNTITMAHDCDDLHVRYKVNDGPAFVPDGYRYNLLVDIDKNPTTGYRGTGNSLSIGADVLIQGGQGKITIFKFTGDPYQEAWGWQQINVYPVSDKALVDGGRDIDFSIRISDLNVFGNQVLSFNWVAWADYPTAVIDFYPDSGFVGDAGGFNKYSFNYTPINGVIANPERGFFASTKSESDNYKPLDLATLQCYRQNEGISLVHRYFYLKNFVNSDISQQYLDLMQADFNKIRQAGLKVIPRFSYSESSGPNLTPPYGDASKERILSHLNQLSSTLNNNSDLIAVMEAGFIGLWGEWWYSDHFQPDANWNDRADVIHGMLDILPANRMIQLRTPRYKQNILSNTMAVDLTTAHNGSYLARIGHHNDCFVSSKSDGGTFTSASEYSYLAEETKWVPMSGETCDYNSLSDPDPSRLSCATALNELAKFHWSFLNLDWYKPLLRKWVDGSCYDEIERRLGYHLVFLQGDYDNQIKPGNKFKFSLRLKNEGFSAPFNPRVAELILRHTDGSIHGFKLSTDPRFWLPGEIHTIADEVSIPANFPAGDYEFLLNLPDPEPELYRRPEYAIRLANANIWEAATGYNRLNHTSSSEPPVYYADTVGITVGKYHTGSLASFKNIDADTYDIKALDVSGGKATDWYASTTITALPFDKVSELNLIYGGQYSQKSVKQEIYLYNYNSASWDLIDTRTVGNTDDVMVRINLATPQAYLSSNGKSRVRVRGFKSGNNQFYSWANFLSWKVQLN